MGLEYFPCYHSYAKKCEKLTDQELGRLFRALIKFSETGERQELAGRESIAFDFIADDIQRAKDAYEDKCRKNTINAAKRTVANGSDRLPSVATDAKNKDKDKDKNKDKSPKGDIARARFTPPTLDEVAAYCSERGNGVNPQQFIDFYTSKGWKVGDQPMKDWKAAVRTWERRDGRQSTRIQTVAQPLTNQTPEQRRAQLERMGRIMNAMGGGEA